MYCTCDCARYCTCGECLNNNPKSGRNNANSINTSQEIHGGSFCNFPSYLFKKGFFKEGTYMVQQDDGTIKVFEIKYKNYHIDNKPPRVSKTLNKTDSQIPRSDFEETKKLDLVVEKQKKEEELNNKLKEIEAEKIKQAEEEKLRLKEQQEKLEKERLMQELEKEKEKLKKEQELAELEKKKLAELEKKKAEEKIKEQEKLMEQEKLKNLDKERKAELEKQKKRQEQEEKERKKRQKKYDEEMKKLKEIDSYGQDRNEKKKKISKNSEQKLHVWEKGTQNPRAMFMRTQNSASKEVRSIGEKGSFLKNYLKIKKTKPVETDINTGVVIKERRTKVTTFKKGINIFV